MKRLLTQSAGSLLLSPAGILFAWLLTIAACKKSETTKTVPSDEMDNIAFILSGEKLSSKLYDAQDEEGIVFVCNGGNDLLILQKITAVSLTSTGTITNASIIHSRYGLLVRNNDTQQIWLYIQNDNESREKFAQVRAILSGDIQAVEIAGTIRIESHLS